MVRSFTMSVPKPCYEQWNSFTPTKEGGFCQQCCKEVRDFTNMTDGELLSFLNERPSHVCGRFKKTQLKPYVNPTHTMFPSFTIAKAGFLALLVTFSVNDIGASASPIPNTEQHFIPSVNTTLDSNGELLVKGKVIDELGDPLPGIEVFLRGTTVGTVTDIDGKFEFPIKLQEGNVLLFSFIGYETEQYKVGKSEENTINIEVKMDTFITMGELTVDEVYTKRHGLITRLWNSLKELFA